MRASEPAGEIPSVAEEPEGTEAECIVISTENEGASATEAEWRDPEDVSPAMSRQGVLTILRFICTVSGNTIRQAPLGRDQKLAQGKALGQE